MNLSIIKKNIAKFTNLKYITNTFLYNKLNNYANISYSQEGEDRILFSLLGLKRKGFYIDVGANHPQRFSNTFLFYNLGWHGINIDANNEVIVIFNKIRPNDLNISCGVGLKEEVREFIVFNESEISTFVKKQAQNIKEKNYFTVKETRQIEIKKLSTILRQYLKPKQVIDFMSIDVEGMDFEAIQSNDWKVYRPSILLIEIYGIKNFNQILKSKITQYLKKYKYEPIAKTPNTIFFRAL